MQRSDFLSSRFILNFLRDGPEVVLPEDETALLRLKKEADFYSLLDLIKVIDELLWDKGVDKGVEAAEKFGTMHKLFLQMDDNLVSAVKLWKKLFEESKGADRRVNSVREDTSHNGTGWLGSAP